MDQSPLGESESTGHCPSKRPPQLSVSPEFQDQGDIAQIDEKIAKNAKMLSMLKESNLLLQQQLQMMERLAEMRIAKMKQEGRQLLTQSGPASKGGRNTCDAGSVGREEYCSKAFNFPEAGVVV